jgi:splicing factor 3B subunit 3
MCNYIGVGSNRDYLIIGSDSGKISIVEFDVTINDWKTVHCETFGKTGCRRIVPGQYVAVDPKGRAVLIGEFPISLRYLPL